MIISSRQSSETQKAHVESDWFPLVSIMTFCLFYLFFDHEYIFIQGIFDCFTDMFTLPAISGNSRYCADSSGIMPLNALNGSSYMYNDESSTLSRPPSYEEAVSSDSMFGLFIVNSGDSYHNSVSHQHAHHDQLDQPPNYHDLLSPTGSTASADKPSNRNAPYVSRDSDTAEYLDTSLDNQCTRFSQIDIVGSTSTLTSPVPVGVTGTGSDGRKGGVILALTLWMMGG